MYFLEFVRQVVDMFPDIIKGRGDFPSGGDFNYNTLAETEALLQTAIGVPGRSIKKIAAATDIKPNTLYKWKSTTLSGAVMVTLFPSPNTQAKNCGLTATGTAL